MVAALFVLNVAKTGATAPTTPLVKPAKRIGWDIEGVGRVRTNAVPASATLATTAIVIRRFIATRVMPPNDQSHRPPPKKQGCPQRIRHRQTEGLAAARCTGWFGDAALWVRPSTGDIVIPSFIDGRIPTPTNTVVKLHDLVSQS